MINQRLKSRYTEFIARSNVQVLLDMCSAQALPCYVRSRNSTIVYKSYQPIAWTSAQRLTQFRLTRIEGGKLCLVCCIRPNYWECCFTEFINIHWSFNRTWVQSHHPNSHFPSLSISRSLVVNDSLFDRFHV